ncbi:MAG TPA: DUF72 domain-containing protein [Vicinamibacterales bacterium]|nr:DUF72 domain-containing protein [Vicinamibacterales bacterium]
MAQLEHAPRHQPLFRVGCSGWQYKHWRGDFYPDGLAAARWLEHYARQFDTVEINNSFYRLPAAHSFETWRERVPAGFAYAVKASRYITHMKKLKDPAAPLDLLFSRVTHLKEALGPVLYQLPPRWPLNFERLTEFLRALPRGFTHVVEFRDPTWYVEPVFEALRAHGVSLCIHDMGGSETGLRMVGPAVYLRFHGPQRYRGRYSPERLAATAAWCLDRLSEGVPVYAYFNNDIGGHAPRDAVRFRELLGSGSAG